MQYKEGLKRLSACLLTVLLLTAVSCTPSVRQESGTDKAAAADGTQSGTVTSDPGDFSGFFGEDDTLTPEPAPERDTAGADSDHAADTAEADTAEPAADIPDGTAADTAAPETDAEPAGEPTGAETVVLPKDWF